MFPARGSYWRRQINILGEAGKICCLGGKWQKKVQERRAESVRKQVLLLVYHHTA